MPAVHAHAPGEDALPFSAPGVPPPSIAGVALWRGHELCQRDQPVVSSSWAQLDAQLPGGGWPTHAVVDVLLEQSAQLEWRLLAPALSRALTTHAGDVVAVAPPCEPYLPGLRLAGLDERRFAWVAAESPMERLWATEQLIKANACAAIVAWLPKTQAPQIRRLQVAAQACESLVFLCRPLAERLVSSAAPLRVSAQATLDWTLEVHVLKRRGAQVEGVVALPGVPAGLAPFITPRLRLPSRLFQEEMPHAPAAVVGRVAAALV